MSHLDTIKDAIYEAVGTKYLTFSNPVEVDQKYRKIFIWQACYNDRDRSLWVRTGESSRDWFQVAETDKEVITAIYSRISEIKLKRA